MAKADFKTAAVLQWLGDGGDDAWRDERAADDLSDALTAVELAARDGARVVNHVRRNLGAACRAPLTGASIMTTDSKRANQLLDLALRHARTIRVVIGELAKLNAERELRIITRQLADLTRRAEPVPHNTGDAP